MSELNLAKIKEPQAAVIMDGVELTEPAQALLVQYPQTADYLAQLLSQQLYLDAIRFLAHALPKREATWWACLCARRAATEQTPANQLQAIELAEAWVYRPTEENCKVTRAAAEAIGFRTPASWAAMAAFWSGDNISPVPYAIVPPDAKLFAKAVAGAVMLAAAQGDASQVTAQYELSLRQGLNIAGGGDGREVA